MPLGVTGLLEPKFHQPPNFLFTHMPNISTGSGTKMHPSLDGIFIPTTLCVLIMSKEMEVKFVAEFY
jgi:hypothetical protein